MRQVLLLRGINLGPRNRVAMPKLREALGEAGYEEVKTYVQSGNIVLSSGVPPDDLAVAAKELIAREFGIEIDVIVRTAEQLGQVVARNPLEEAVEDPKRYQVTFFAAEPPAELVGKLAAAATESERFAVTGREVYAWHPDGVARSKLWSALASKSLPIAATSRNWTTVTTLLQMAVQ